MSTFDVAICLGQQSLTTITAALYKRPNLRARLFRGCHSAPVEGIQANVTWDVQQPPKFNLNPPPPNLWANAIAANGVKAPPSANAFVVTLPALNVSLGSAGAPPVATTTSVDVICSIALSGRTVTLSPVGVVVDLSHATPTDQIIYKAILIPQLLAQIATLLSGQHIPKIDFQGLSFGNATLLVEGGRVVGAAFLEGRPGVPDAASLRSAPPGEFYVLLGGDALQHVVQSGVQPLRGKTESVHGSASFGIGNASYSASLRLDSLNAQVKTPTTLRVQAGVTLAASAGIDVLPAIMNQIAHGVTDAAKAVANVASDAANAVAHGATNAANTVAHGVSNAANTVAHALKSY